jgi:hypothetical protein
LETMTQSDTQFDLQCNQHILHTTRWGVGLVGWLACSRFVCARSLHAKTIRTNREYITRTKPLEVPMRDEIGVSMMPLTAKRQKYRDGKKTQNVTLLWSNLLWLRIHLAHLWLVHCKNARSNVC